MVSLASKDFGFRVKVQTGEPGQDIMFSFLCFGQYYSRGTLCQRTQVVSELDKGARWISLLNYFYRA